ncbi:MAG: putative transcriptional regulator [Polaribacter sp.]|jgi:predicted transcriptional regulator
MTTRALKTNLHKLIDETDDIGFLKKIEEALTLLRSAPVRKDSLSTQEKEMMERGLTAVDEGEVVSDEETKDQFAKWLNRNNE